MSNHSFKIIACFALIVSCRSNEIDGTVAERPLNISGIYPHLAYYNQESECGTGAVVPWADRLWVVTYGPHLPYGSSDNLYEITEDLHIVARPESTGGTPANRMIHRESNQLFIGPYVVDEDRNVRTISYKDAPGRYTGIARHLTDPARNIYIATMEEGFYEVNVTTLETKMLYEDGNERNKKGNDISVNQPGSLLPGAHGKGVYSGQGVMVYSNNGEALPEALKQFDIQSGVLAEWDGKEWNVIRRNQFVEVTGPGGILGNANPETDPIWATGWDHRSVIIAVRDSGEWSFYRIPKASHSYDGAHGWNTEWPRIRDVGTPERPNYLMTMHGMFWRFPGTFSSKNSGGIRPRSAYLKVIGDFTRWKDQIVFGCDDSAQKEFLNKRKVKGNIEGPGQSNSNLWFTSSELPDNLGPVTAEGAVWLNEAVPSGEASEPFLFAGWPLRSAWVKNHGDVNTKVTFEVSDGNTKWTPLRAVEVKAGTAMNIGFSENEKGEWIRAVCDRPTQATVHFYYTEKDERDYSADEIFQGLAEVGDDAVHGGLMYGLGNDRRALGLLANSFSADQISQVGYYELNASMKLERKQDPETASFIEQRFAIPKDVLVIDEASVLIVDDRGRRWRLPRGPEQFTHLTKSGHMRIAREVATERDLFNCHGTFYELPAENADGFAKIRPVASHNFRIHDYASYRGMLIMTGIHPQAEKNKSHVIVSDDRKAAVWVGVIDDLWKLGKPVGKGGPWKNTTVKAGEPSDPYLIGFYDHRKLTLSHDQKRSVTYVIEADPVGNGFWMNYKTVEVKPDESFEFTFPPDFQARWIRFTSNRDAVATAWLDYD